MRKKIIIGLCLGVNMSAFGQVGINTQIPQSTLDIVAKVPTGSSPIVDGILVPRVDRQRAQTMSSVPTSTLIYVNNILTGSKSGTAINIDTTGFYYFENGIWKKM